MFSDTELCQKHNYITLIVIYRIVHHFLKKEFLEMLYSVILALQLIFDCAQLQK